MHDRRVVTIKHEYIVVVALSEFAYITQLCSTSLRRYYYDVISGQRQNLIISETVHDGRVVTTNHCYKVRIALPKSIWINCLQRPLAKKTTRRHFRIMVELNYIGNGA